MLGLDALQFVHELVKRGVGDLRCVHHVVQVLVAPNFIAQKFGALRCLLRGMPFTVHGQDYRRSRATTCYTSGSQRFTTHEPDLVWWSQRMEPLTHFLTGACIGRAGLNRKTACATVVAVLA